MTVSTQHFQKKVLQWFDLHGRKNLPWQINKTPYRVWVSEIMLQQTQVTTVIPYFLRFMERFPDVESLANANEDEVLHLWTGLGYYTRARNLHRTAKIINQFSKFPNDLHTLQELPGIGRSTAAAILSIAFEKPAAILDGNVKRVLTRVHGITEWPGEKRIHDQLWLIAEKLAPQTRTADYSQAMMDLGATICVRGKPACERCPLKKDCLAHKLGIEKTLPASKPRKKIPVRSTTLLVLINNDSVLLEKRPPTGVWSGLWSLPEINETLSLPDLKKFCRKHFNLEIKAANPATSFRHTFSHYHLDITPIMITTKKATPRIMEDQQQIWYNLHQPATIGLPAPIKKLISEIDTHANY